MAIKLTSSQSIRDRATGKVTVQHDYIKSHSVLDLIEKYNSGNLKPKVKQKVKNELVKRGGVVFN
jgi:hypothetical protein|tara:strand:+ start:554 stop:748 length:195 start_codon:yes stop_codon:yes gene_type:complete